MTRTWKAPIRSRSWPDVIPDRTLHFIGDLHIQRQAASRLALMREDVKAIGPDMPRFQVGDMTVDSLAGEDAAAMAYLDSLGGDWWAIVGNHDTVGRTATQAAATWGMDKDFTVDLGYCAVIGLGPLSGTVDGLFWGSATRTYLDQQLTAHADKPCIITAHHPFANTVGLAADDQPTKKSSFDLGFWMRGAAAGTGTAADQAPDYWAVVEAHPNAVAWLSGHTHSNLRSVGLVKPVTVAGRNFVHVNASCPEGPYRTISDWLTTIYITVLDDRLEVRFRDHGARTWIGSGSEQRRVWTIAL